jgi:transcriptional regulator
MPETADDVLNALDLLLEALRANDRLEKELVQRARALKAMRQKGLSYREIVPKEKRPLVVELLREMQEQLSRAGRTLRSVEARALREEGLTLDEIARLFGVTRQRVITLLREDADRRAGAPGPARRALKSRA